MKEHKHGLVLCLCGIQKLKSESIRCAQSVQKLYNFILRYLSMQKILTIRVLALALGCVFATSSFFTMHADPPKCVGNPVNCTGTWNLGEGGANTCCLPAVNVPGFDTCQGGWATTDAGGQCGLLWHPSSNGMPCDTPSSGPQNQQLTCGGYSSVTCNAVEPCPVNP